MIIFDPDARPPKRHDTKPARHRSARRDAIAPEAQPRDHPCTVASRRGHAAQAQSRRPVDRGAVRRGGCHRRRLLQPLREQGGVFQRLAGTCGPRQRGGAVPDDGPRCAARCGSRRTLSDTGAGDRQLDAAARGRGARRLAAQRHPSGALDAVQGAGTPDRCACDAAAVARHGPRTPRGQGACDRFRFPGGVRNAGERHPQRPRAAVDP